MAAINKRGYEQRIKIRVCGIVLALASGASVASDFIAEIEVDRERMPMIEELEYLRSNTSGATRQLIDRLISSSSAGNPAFYNFYIWLEPQGAGTIANATLTTPTNATHDLASEEDGDDWELEDKTFTSLTGLSDTFPPGTYTLTVTFSGGAIVSKTVTMPFYQGFPAFVDGHLDEEATGHLKLQWSTVANVGEYEIYAELLPGFDEVFDSDNLYINHANTTVTPLGVNKNAGHYFVSIQAEQQIADHTPVQIGVEFNSFSSWTTLYDDADGDRIADFRDNCASESNADQANFDTDERGDACDPDDDNDGAPDSLDAFAFDASESVDTDGDGIGNNADTDDDGDKLSDAEEAEWRSDPLRADTDGDGTSDGAEVAVGRSPILNEPAAVGVLNILLSET